LVANATMDDNWSELYEGLVEEREDSSRREADAFDAQSRRGRPYASATKDELLSRSNPLLEQALQPHARKRGWKDTSTNPFTQMTASAPVAPDAERSSSNSPRRRFQKASSRDSLMQMAAAQAASDAEAGPATSFLPQGMSLNSLSSTAAPAASDTGSSFTVPRRPSKEHGYEAATISTSSKHQSSNQLTSTKNKRQSRSTAKPDTPSGSSGQVDQLSGDPDTELPTAVETTNLDRSIPKPISQKSEAAKEKADHMNTEQ
jgi:hypothetical protein